MVSFTEYFQNSIGGLLTNGLFIGIMLAAITTMLRYYFNKILEKYKPKTIKRIIIEIIYFVFLVPASLLILMGIIFILWLISLINR